MKRTEITIRNYDNKFPPVSDGTQTAPANVVQHDTLRSITFNILSPVLRSTGGTPIQKYYVNECCVSSAGSIFLVTSSAHISAFSGSGWQHISEFAAYRWPFEISCSLLNKLGLSPAVRRRFLFAIFRNITVRKEARLQNRKHRQITEMRPRSIIIYRFDRFCVVIFNRISNKPLRLHWIGLHNFVESALFVLNALHKMPQTCDSSDSFATELSSVAFKTLNSSHTVQWPQLNLPTSRTDRMQDMSREECEYVQKVSHHLSRQTLVTIILQQQDEQSWIKVLQAYWLLTRGAFNVTQIDYNCSKKFLQPNWPESQFSPSTSRFVLQSYSVFQFCRPLATKFGLGLSQRSCTKPYNSPEHLQPA